MKQINFKTLSLKNFLSTGNQPLELDLSNKGIFVITGLNKDKGDNESNGTGKCLDKKTKILIKIPNSEIAKIFSEFQKNV